MKIAKLAVLVVFVVILGIIIEALTQSNDKKNHNQIAGKPYLNSKAGELKKTIVTLHLEQSIVPATNVLWCNTFQLAWNELIALTGGPIVMDSAPPIVSVLNKKSVQRRSG